jgi:sRNA-binding carbon storage regulator CsrA
MSEQSEGCVVMSIRDEKEFVVLDTVHGPVRIEVRNSGRSKVRMYVRAPLAVKVHREKRLKSNGESE